MLDANIPQYAPVFTQKQNINMFELMQFSNSVKTFSHKFYVLISNYGTCLRSTLTAVLNSQLNNIASYFLRIYKLRRNRKVESNYTGSDMFDKYTCRPIDTSELSG